MRLGEIFRFEVAYQAGRASTWIYPAVLLCFSYLVAADGYAELARSGSHSFNSPLSIAALTLLGTLLAMLMAPALAGDAAARDVQTRMHPLLYTTPVGRAAYLGGRFLAAFVLHALVLVAAPLGLLVAALAPGADPAIIGPFRAAAYVGAYAAIALPNAFVATALQFSLAVLSRRAMTSYLGSLLLFFTAALSWLLVAERWGRWDLAKLLDPLGLTVLAEVWRATTPAERDMLPVWSDGSLLANRLLWVGVALGVLALTYRRFRFGHHAGAGRRIRGAPHRDALPATRGAAALARGTAAAAPRAARTFGLATHARQALAIARESFLEVARTGGWLPPAALGAFVVLVAAEALELFGVPRLPTTEQMTVFIGGPQSFVGTVVPLLILYYAGELVWQEREAGMSEIADVAPVPDGVRLLGKLLALALVLVSLQALLMAAAMALQVRLGYNAVEVGLYLRILFGMHLADHVLFALLAVVVHVLVDHKYVGHLAALVTYVLVLFAPALGVEHNLLLYGSDPGWSYSDMRGLEPFLGPWLWFKLYWGAWALLLAVAAKLLWVRGRERGLRERLVSARHRLTRATAAVGAVAVALILAVGGFIFYNTNVLNEYRTASDEAERRAEYERRYGRYEGIPQPLLTAVSLRVEIYPERREAEISGSYRLVNESGAAIPAVHVATAASVVTDSLHLDRPAEHVIADERLGHQVYALAQPLEPGDSLRLAFRVRFQPRGFPNRGIDAAVASNGTFINAEEWLPAIGYQADRELGGGADRRARGLAPRAPVRPLDDPEARRDVAGERARVAFEAVVGTDRGQTAVAPGRLRRTWTEGRRRYFHYATDAPIRNDYALFSAAYGVHEGRWNGVAIQVLHHPGHAWNAERMLRSVRASLDYFTRHYGPYPHGQIRLVEHPGPGSSTLHAAPINIWYQEGFSLFDPARDPRGIDFPFAVVAHEVAHQWWGGQVTPARVEGRGVLTESLAWFSAMGVVEETYGREHLRRLVGLMQEVYLSPRARAGVPLLRAYEQFDAYRKGPFAMYALREYIGADRVNAALRRLVELHGAGTPPLPTSLDLYRELQAVTPDSLRPLLADLFERNTYWELATERVAAEQTGAGTWRVTLDVRARKVVVDTAGVETDVPMDDLVEVGVFGDAEGRGLGEPLYRRMHRLRSGAQRIVVTVREQPHRAGIDPRNLLIDVEGGDNVSEATYLRPFRSGAALPSPTVGRAASGS